MDKIKFKKVLKEGYYSPRMGVYVHGRDDLDTDDIIKKLSTKYKFADNKVIVGGERYTIKTVSNLVVFTCEKYEFDSFWQNGIERQMKELKEVLNAKSDGNWTVKPKDSSKIYLELTFRV